MMTKMENSSSEQESGRSWSSSKIVTFGDIGDVNVALADLREREKFGVSSVAGAAEVSMSVTHQEAPHRQPAAPCRSMSTASSTGDEVSDSESAEAMKLKKRQKANANERKRSHGINECIKQQAQRVRQFTNKPTDKMGKKEIMMAFTNQYDLMAEKLAGNGRPATTPPPTVASLVHSRPMQATALTAASKCAYAPVNVYLQTPVMPCTPTSHQPHGVNQERAPAAPVPAAATLQPQFHDSHMLPMNTGFATPVAQAGFQNYSYFQHQTTFMAPFQLPPTPSSSVVAPSQPLVPAIKRPADDSSRSEEAMSPPPKVARRVVNDDDFVTTPSRPTRDRSSSSSASNNLLILVSACDYVDRRSSDNRSSDSE